MNTYKPVYGVYVTLSLLVILGCTKTSPQDVPIRNQTPIQGIEQPVRNVQPTNEQQAGNERQITKEEAIDLANQAARKSYPSLRAFKIIACEQRFSWLIIYDGGGPEYFIGKESRKILGVQKLPQSLSDASDDNLSRISKEEAIAVARKDFFTLYGERTKSFDPIACELTHAWRIFFEDKIEPGQNPATVSISDPPNYVIDKKTGKIIYRQKY